MKLRDLLNLRVAERPMLALALAFSIVVLIPVLMQLGFKQTPDSELYYKTYGPYSGGKPKAMVVMLHGSGDILDNFLALARPWAPYMPDVIFVAPRAPLEVLAYNYSKARVWYEPVLVKTSRIDSRMKEVVPILEKFINDRRREYGLNMDQIAIFGFSQGGTVALSYLLSQQQNLAGVFIVSGRYVKGLGCPETPSPVFLHYRSKDPFVDLAEYRHVAEALRNCSIPYEGTIAQGAGHFVDNEALTRARLFLTKALLPGAEHNTPFGP